MLKVNYLNINLNSVENEQIKQELYVTNDSRTLDFIRSLHCQVKGPKMRGGTRPKKFGCFCFITNQPHKGKGDIINLPFSTNIIWSKLSIILNKIVAFNACSF